MEKSLSTYRCHLLSYPRAGYLHSHFIDKKTEFQYIEYAYYAIYVWQFAFKRCFISEAKGCDIGTES